MSLLLKALRQAEQSHASHSQNGGGSDAAMEKLALEPLASTLAKPKREWVEPPGTEDGAALPGKMREWRWPLGLVPTATLFALLIAAAYGVYFYLMTQPQTWTAPEALTAPATPPPATPPAFAPAPSPKAAPPASALPGVAPAPAQKQSSRLPFEALSAKPLKPSVTTRQILPSPARQKAINPAASSPAASTINVLTPAPPASLLEEAYAAFQTGRLDEARTLYQQRANVGPSADALLGLAAVAQSKGQTTEAIRLYQSVLEISPRNTVAQAALLDTLGTTDPVSAESRLKMMIAREPSSYLFYALGNLYAEQGRWSDAELANFEAHQREPGNADYTFNLAVSLDHLKQPDAAILYYENALRLAGPASRFDRSQAISRIQQLKAR